ncbi:VOC family protein [Streptomyces sp. LX-29]|uniref:VOC family protein n=1 Tax=Streptomyces sp. LX-29 TaxID=2900152 RepID=UPI00240D5853|nr:VOC family protein [Streptomyces sp. LX-29]WFB07858.1 VOC family protein [Streptomyces sp. LX-29]
MATFQEGVPCWVDALLPDVEAGKRFYGELFGWTFQAGGQRHGSYIQAFHHGENVAALTPKPDGRMPTVWNVYFATPDASGAAARIAAAGGQIITAPMAVGEFGVLATAADPGGAVFGLWQAGTHAGFQESGEPGTYVWTEVYIRDRDKEAVDAFYSAVFAYEGLDASEEGIDFAVWSPAGTRPGPDAAVMGRAVLPKAVPVEMPAHFLVYFRVSDCDGAVETAARLGGRTMAAPQDTPYGRFAIVADNQGAMFAVIDTDRVTKGA